MHKAVNHEPSSTKTGVTWGYGVHKAVNREPSCTKAGADECPRGFCESCVPDSTKEASMTTDAHVPNRHVKLKQHRTF